MKRSPMKRGSSLLRRTPMPQPTQPIRPQSKRRQAQRRVRAAAERVLGREGTQGVCAKCGLYGYVNGHERLARSQGGDPTNPDCLLCPPCNGWAEDHPREAAEQGWKISRKWDAA
jgi:ssDNA-binding Zn-finger/Zn-ribbon topoisomerase 1